MLSLFLPLPFCFRFSSLLTTFRFSLTSSTDTPLPSPLPLLLFSLLPSGQDSPSFSPYDDDSNDSKEAVPAAHYFPLAAGKCGSHCIVKQRSALLSAVCIVYWK